MAGPKRAAAGPPTSVTACGVNPVWRPAPQQTRGRIHVPLQIPFQYLRRDQGVEQLAPPLEGPQDRGLEGLDAVAGLGDEQLRRAFAGGHLATLVAVAVGGPVLPPGAGRSPAR